MTGEATLLGGLTADRFMRRHWQRKPLLVRQAIDPAGLGGAIDLALLRRLAADADVESRLVTAPGYRPRPGVAASDRWTLRHGPIARLPSTRCSHWTVLVQGLDLHVEPARALLDRFRFVADARLDDLMVSYATDGGGVGPHVDSYDVFLLQLDGQRRWSIAPPAAERSPLATTSSAVPGGPLRQLAAFEPTGQWLLDPGDLLYLPPGWAHDGVAAGTCLTASIGFRSPTPNQWLDAIQATLADDAASAARLSRPFPDRGARSTDRPARIPAAVAGRLLEWQRAFRPPAHVLEQALGRLLSEPKPQVWFEADPSRRLVPDRGLRVDRRSRLIYRGPWVFINGDVLRPPARSRRWLQRLADRRQLSAVDLRAALRDDWVAATLGDWLAAGWIGHASD